MIIYQTIIDNTHIIGISAVMSQLHSSAEYDTWKKFSFLVYTPHYPITIETPFLDTKDLKHKEEYTVFYTEYRQAKEIIGAIISRQPLERKRAPRRKTKEPVIN